MQAGEVKRRMRTLAFAPPERVARGRAIVLAPHADDESLGCGGLIATLADAGHQPVIVIVTDGTGSHPGSIAYPAERLRRVRQTEALEAAAILGVQPDAVHFLDVPDTRAPHDGPELDDAVRRIGELVGRYGIGTLFAPWEHDPHGDHGAVRKMADGVARHTGVRVVRYPVWGWTLPPDHWLPPMEVRGARLDITPVLPRKRRAIAAHASQYSNLITDDPNGFRLPPDLLAVFAEPYEVFLFDD